MKGAAAGLLIEANISRDMVADRPAPGQCFNKSPQALGVGFSLFLICGRIPMQGSIAARCITSARVISGGFFLANTMRGKPDNKIAIKSST